ANSSRAIASADSNAFTTDGLPCTPYICGRSRPAGGRSRSSRRRTSRTSPDRLLRRLATANARDCPSCPSSRPSRVRGTSVLHTSTHTVASDRSHHCQTILDPHLPNNGGSTGTGRVDRRGSAAGDTICTPTHHGGGTA